MRTIIDEVREHPFTQGLRPEHVRLMAGCAKNVTLAPGYVHRQGEPASTFYLLREGEVALELHAEGRGGLVVETLHGGEALGWSWLFEPYRWTFDARALVPTRAIELDGVCLRGKCDADPVLGYDLMKRVARVFTARLAATRLQLLDLYGQPR